LKGFENMAIKKGIKINLTKFEKLLYGFALVLVLFFVCFHVFTKATMTKLNIEVEEIKAEVNSTEKKIECITMKVNELASLENISMVADQMGLSYSNENIKVID